METLERIQPILRQIGPADRRKSAGKEAWSPLFFGRVAFCGLLALPLLEGLLQHCGLTIVFTMYSFGNGCPEFTGFVRKLIRFWRNLFRNWHEIREIDKDLRVLWRC